MQLLELVIFALLGSQGLKLESLVASNWIRAVVLPVIKMIGIYPAVTHFLIDKNLPKNGLMFWYSVVAL